MRSGGNHARMMIFVVVTAPVRTFMAMQTLLILDKTGVHGGLLGMSTQANFHVTSCNQTMIAIESNE